MEIKKVFVPGGGGVMGSGIVQVCAQNGYDVVMQDVNEKSLSKGLGSIKWSVGKMVEKGTVKGTVDEIMSRIKTSTKLEDARGAEVIIESVFEDTELKQGIFHQLEELCPGALMATNTSAIPITNIAAGMKHPDKFVGLHFFNPAPVQRAVEVVKGIMTSEETMQIASKFCQSLGKEIVRVNKDVYGFALIRVDVASYVEAMRMVEEGVASVEDIDKGIRLGYGRAMGPFEQRDFAGIELGLTVLQNIYDETGDAKFFPPRILRRMVAAGHLGRKVGIGWYRYDEKGNKLGPA
jgi:3-hydroxybutyryl-CoA dehydrogenase